MSDLGKKKVVWTSFRLRVWNEVATLFLVVIVFLVVMKTNMDWMYGIIGFFGTSISLMLAIKLYKTIREKRQENIGD